MALTMLVWAVSLSLATTWEITIVFSSSAYLDVSVQQVCVYYVPQAGQVFLLGDYRIKTF